MLPALPESDFFSLVENSFLFPIVIWYGVPNFREQIQRKSAEHISLLKTEGFSFQASLMDRGRRFWVYCTITNFSQLVLCFRSLYDRRESLSSVVSGSGHCSTTTHQRRHYLSRRNAEKTFQRSWSDPGTVAQQRTKDDISWAEEILRRHFKDPDLIRTL